jgi:superfamily I DNA/RNA helicase
MDSDGLMTMAGLYESLAGTMRQVKNPPFDFIVIDEAQDISVPQLRLIAALGAHQPGGIFFAGDMGQRIFQPPFSWKALGVDIRGRSYALRINYRTSHQIRRKADYLLNANITDPDFVSEKRREAVSIFSGPEPVVAKYADLPEEISLAGGWLKERLEDGLKPHEIALFVRSQSQLPRARTVALASGWPFVELDNQTSPQDGYLTLSTMHLAKGLEFKAVIILACDQGIIPCQARVESIADEADLDEVLETERHLLYVACTRARDYLLVSGLCPGSEFLDDLSDPLSARLPWT